MQHVAIYVRVSSRKQDMRSQEPDLKQWIEAFAVSEGVCWYSDRMTGTTMNRPGWSRLEADIDAGRVSTVVVWRLDRLGRTASGLTALFEKLSAKRINFVSIRDGIDLSTAAGRLMANVLASVAAFENEIRAERSKAGQEAARASGKRWGGSKKGRRIKVTDEAVESIRRMAAEGATKTAMSRATGLSRPTVYAVLETVASPAQS